MFEEFVQQYITTSRLKTAYYRAGQKNKKKLMLVHGNLSSSVFFLPLLPVLSEYFDVVIPDLRCFGNTQALPIDATRGFRDWSDDLVEFTDALGWDSFSLLGWSLGGGVAMRYTIDHSDRIEKLILLAPCPPFGFGGTRDEDGGPIYPLGLGTGAGCVNKAMMFTAAMKGTAALRHIMRTFYFSPNFQPHPDIEELLIEGISSVHFGDGMYPGDFYYTMNWPHVLPGETGVLNAMSPKWANQSPLLDVLHKPDILWIRGIEDDIVSDHSVIEFGHLGSKGLVPGWPGSAQYPPQPMVTQTRYFLNEYRKRGGNYQEVLLPGGHGCHLEAEGQFVFALTSFLF